MEVIIAFATEYIVELIFGSAILFLELIGKKKTAEKVRKAKEKQLKKLKKKRIKRVHVMQKDEKRIEKLEEELNKNA